MKRWKAAFFDIDNTLYDWVNHRYEQSGIEAIKKLKKAGVKVFISTARPYGSMKEFGIFDLGIHWDGYIVSAGAIAVCGSRCLQKQLMRPSDVRKIIKIALANHLTMEVVSPKTRYLIAPGNTFLTNYYGTYADSTPPVHRYWGGEVTGALLFAPVEYDEAFHKALPHLIYYRFHECGVDIMPVEHRKGEAIKTIIGDLGISKDETIAFGDDFQDISMKDSAFFVCMGNGREEVKAEADFVTKSIEEGGIAYALEELGVFQ